MTTRTDCHPKAVARSLALQLACAEELGGATDLDYLAEVAGARRASVSYAGRIAAAVGSRKPEIDSSISPLLENWEMDRLPVVDRNILRIGAAESSMGVPRRVVISEMVELAKRFGGKDSPAFVNGVLDKLI